MVALRGRWHSAYFDNSATRLSNSRTRMVSAAIRSRISASVIRAPHR